ncbi:MAG: FliH/SctL family protein [Synergistales bacterium]
MSSSGRAPEGRVFRNLPVSREKAHLCAPPPSAGLEGGRQIDPFLVANLQIQELQRKIESLLESESRWKAELASLRAEREKEKALVGLERDDLRREAAALADKSRREAAAAGFEEGYRKGLAKAKEDTEREIRQDFGDRFGRLEDLLATLAAALEGKLAEGAEGQSRRLLTLWNLALEKLLHREVELDPDAAWRLFRAILQRVGDRSRVRVLLNPSDRELFLERGREMEEIRRMSQAFDLISDEGIEKGSCLVDTNLGVYDARWKSQLDAIGKEVDSLSGGAGA